MEHTTTNGQTQRRYEIGLSVAIGLVVGVSLLAYGQLLPSWIAPGNADKVFHFAMGGLLAFLLDGALRRRAAWSGPFAPPLSSVLVLAALGIDEYLQRFSAVRTSSIWDFAADVVGVAFFTYAARRLFSAAGRSGPRRSPCS